MSEQGSFPRSRRTVLALLGAPVLGSLAGCSQNHVPTSPSDEPTDTSSRSTDRSTPGEFEVPSEFDFDEFVDASDVGITPGSGPIDETLTEALTDGRCLVLERGHYRLDDPLRIEANTAGLIGPGARLSLPGNREGAFLTVENNDRFLLSGIDVDMRGDRSGHMHLTSSSRFHVEDVEYLGRGGGTGYAFNTAVTEEDGVGVLRNVRVTQGHRIDGYNEGDGRIGIWAGWDHAGTLRVEHCDFREFGNNAIYAGRTGGDVQVVDSYFENNSPASVRISGKDSYVEDTTVRLDLGAYTGPTPTRNFNPRGVVIDGRKPLDVPIKPAGAEVRNCTFEYLDTGDVTPSVQGVIDVWGTARSLTVRNTEIGVDLDDVPAVRREQPGARGEYRPGIDQPPEPHWVRLHDVEIVGSAERGAAISLVGADGSYVVRTEIRQPGLGRTALESRDTIGVKLERTRMLSGGFPITVRMPNETLDGLADCLLATDSATSVEMLNDFLLSIGYRGADLDTVERCIGADAIEGGGSDGGEGEPTEQVHVLSVCDGLFWVLGLGRGRG